MRIVGATLILALLLSTTICKGEENRDQEAEEDPATENSNFWVEIVVPLVVIACFVAMLTICCCFWVYYRSRDRFQMNLNAWDEIGPIESFRIIQDLSYLIIDVFLKIICANSNIEI